MNMMKALVFHEKGRMSLETVPIPKPKKNEVLVRIKYCGICGTDIHMFNGHAPATFPLIPGHEASGEVVALGDEVKKLKIGDRVAIDPNIGCGYCLFCQKGWVHLCKNQKPFGVHSHGGFAEYAVIAETHAFLFPDSISFIEGAMVEPAACCMRGIQMAKVKVGSTVLIHGAGAIGNMNMQFAKLAGATHIIVSEPIESRRKLAEELGADIVLDPVRQDITEEVRKILPDGPEIIIECAGKTHLVEESVKLVSRGGTVVMFGICPADEYARINPNYMNDAEITLCGSFNNPFTHAPSIQAIASKRIKVENLVSHKFKLEQYQEAFSLFGKEESLKIVFELN